MPRASPSAQHIARPSCCVLIPMLWAEGWIGLRRGLIGDVHRRRILPRTRLSSSREPQTVCSLSIRRIQHRNASNLRCQFQLYVGGYQHDKIILDGETA